MRWKAHTDIWLIKYRAKMPLKVWYSSLGQRALPLFKDAQQHRPTARRERERESYHGGGWTGEIWGRQWGWQTNSRGHWGQPVGRNTIWAQIISCRFAGLLQHVQRRIPQRPRFSVTWRRQQPVSGDAWLSQVCPINLGILRLLPDYRNVSSRALWWARVPRSCR